MEAAELRNGLHLATTGTDKGTSRRSLLNWGSPELMRALLRQGALSAAAVWRPSSAAGRPVENSILHTSRYAVKPVAPETYDILKYSGN